MMLRYAAALYDGEAARREMFRLYRVQRFTLLRHAYDATRLIALRYASYRRC